MRIGYEFQDGAINEFSKYTDEFFLSSAVIIYMQNRYMLALFTKLDISISLCC